MRKSVIAILAVWAVGLMAFLVWDYSKSPSPEPVAPIRIPPELTALLADFSAGAEAYNRKVPIEEACAGRTGATKSFCLHGYMVSDHQENIRTLAANPKAAADFKTPAAVERQPEFRALWFGSIGAALAQSQLTPAAAKSYISESSAMDNVIDGWAFSHSITQGFATAERLCLKSLSGHELATCLFGAGRGAFLRPTGFADTLYVTQPSKAGYLFAQGFSSPGDDATFKTPMGKAGRFVRQLWTEDGSSKHAKGKADECFSRKHVLDCAELF